MIKSCYSFNLAIRNIYARWRVIIRDKPIFVSRVASGSSRTAYPWLLSHEEAPHRLPTTELIMNSFNVKRTSEIYFNNLIIKMKEKRTKEIKLLISNPHLVKLEKIPGFQISTDILSYAHLVTTYQLVNSIETKTARVFSFYICTNICIYNLTHF